METAYQPQKSESEIYKMWEEKGYFTPSLDSSKKPFTIIMPPPNANGALHIGHAVFVTLEDIMARYYRMKGFSSLWLPGADHAGIMTQVAYEKELKKQGKSRFDLGREEFYKQTYEFSMKNREIMESQLRKLGASCDWSRKKFTLDSEISEAVYHTFKKMYDDGLIYRGERMINWCPRCRTALSDLEVEYEERRDPLYYIKYGPLTLATVRLETKFGDTAVAVNPGDKRYKDYIGKEIEIQTVLGKAKIKVIADKLVDPDFGTGVVKITPAHDPNDFEVGQRHKLEIRQVIGFDGRLNEKAGKYAGMKVLEARKIIAEDMEKMGLMKKIDNDYTHRVAVCERCKNMIEPLVSKQWFIKTKELAEPAIKAVKNKKIEFIPKRFEKVYYHWMRDIKDWCISRQIWWGHQIPVFYCEEKLDKSQVLKSKNQNFSVANIDGVEGHIIVTPEKIKECPVHHAAVNQDPDTLDTWFSSGQWPFTVFGWPKEMKDYKYFYPTTVMETGWDILFFWVARMIMMGIYCTGKPPFKHVYLHGLVRDKDRQKMSKSKGNVIDPLGVVDLYGADALRMALVFGTAAGNDIIISEDKIVAHRKFANKIWNASRFVLQNLGDFSFLELKQKDLKFTKEDKWIISELDSLIKKTEKAFQKFSFHQPAEEIYAFFWHKFCDKTIEDVKKRINNSQDEKDKATGKWVLYKVLLDSLKLLHPFMPFVTEEVYQMLPKKPKEALIVEDWPK